MLHGFLLFVKSIKHVSPSLFREKSVTNSSLGKDSV
uniref:Uncharacterized protein n=1 Tax=Arundo donax TaxID=35708 RepID=A0A0A9B7C4_ARUDO